MSVNIPRDGSSYNDKESSSKEMNKLNQEQNQKKMFDFSSIIENDRKISVDNSYIAALLERQIDIIKKNFIIFIFLLLQY